MSLKKEVRRILEEEDGVDARFFANVIRHVVSGTTVRRRFKYVERELDDGTIVQERKLVAETTTQSPKDMLAGLTVADGVFNGELGIAERGYDLSTASKRALESFAPEIDDSVVHNAQGTKAIEQKS